MSPPKNEALDWLRLIRSQNVGPMTFYKLLERFGSAKAALDALPDLAKRGGAKAFVAHPKAAAEREIEALEKLGGRLVLRTDEHFPPLLSQVEDAPPLISVLGHPHLLKKRTVAVVGARNASLSGKNFARKISADLGAAGFLVASGMARGLDAAAHQGAMDSGTVAVLGGGVDVVYPRENEALYEELCQRGAILSEVELGTKPQARHFPRRNRIISGMARATIVVEASLHSGSLITARMALEQGREVCAVPGSPSDPRAAGCNKLIKDGANLTQNAQDVLDVLLPILNSPLSEPKRLDFKEKTPSQPSDAELDRARASIQEMLSPAPVTVDELVRNCQFSPAAVALVLLELELAGRLERHPGNRVSLI
ncbi:DNA-processing protein DprA [Magnetovibrio blakemorei]|uniref:DNA protecting protein DprA n=1 Tax=Magnetovibrio blakemorei TaxID=28181 RepID=A0A1E5Q7U9_9PROT|nr:DNA-processing protein DprA [Magnetovibrio blakemorei]OEJ66794.1 DNA protecting protein DprA [Magnetovibrio blakemorei]